MAQGFINKIKNWVSGDPFEEDMYHLEEEFDYHHRPSHGQHFDVDIDPSLESPLASGLSKKPKKSAKIIEHPNANKTHVVVIEPRAFEEALEIIEHLRTKKSVILNLHMLDTTQSQRVVDFLSGATHAIDGNQQRIGDGVFIFTPNNVSIRSENEKAAPLEDGFWKHQQY